MRLSADEIREMFKSHGLRPTRQREVLYAALCESVMHPTAEELFQSVREQDPGMSLATVYNALDAFQASKLCRRLNRPDGGPARFDGDMGEHAHIATPDGRVIDLSADLSRRVLARIGPDLIAELERTMTVKVESISLQFIAEAAGGNHAANGHDAAE